MPDYDAVIVGAGPNGLSAAIALARAGRRVLVVEGRDRIGGGCRTDELTLPGFRHDVCSTVFALGSASPFLSSLRLERYGLEWVQPEIPVAHALDHGAVALHRSVARTAEGLGPDGPAYERLVAPFVERPDAFYATVLGPVMRIPPKPLTGARLAVRGLASVARLVRRFRTAEAKSLLAGLGAHAITDLGAPLTAAVAVVLAVAGHTEGYPFARGGAQSLTDAMAAHLSELGGEVETGTWVETIDALPSASAYVLDVMPAAAVRLTAGRLRLRRARSLDRWRHGPGSYKVDYATSAPIPWSDPLLRRAGTIHVGGTFDEVAAAERAPWEGRHPERPFLLVTQPTVADRTRAPDGKHVVWAYAHVPNGSERDISDEITAQIERFAPGFRETIIARHVMSPGEYAAYNPNNVGGDIAGGRFGLQEVVAGPRLFGDPYKMGEGIYLCSAATPPGAGVHGMSGDFAARSVLRDLGDR
jgi:phytoene dehydrogenase-like protein